MLNSLRDLIHDTLAYAKDPLCSSRQPFLVTLEDYTFFQNKEVASFLPTEKQGIVSSIPASKASSPAHSRSSSIDVKTPNPAPLRPLKEIPSSNRGLDRKDCGLSKTNLSNSWENNTSTKVPALDKSSESVQKNFLPIQKTLQRLFPSLKLVDSIPDDKEAKKRAYAWKEKIQQAAEVILLACDSHADTLEFLKNLGKAIHHHLAKVKILMAEGLEREKRWDLFLQNNSSRLIISSEAIHRLPELMRFYTSSPDQAQFFLAHTPLLILSPISMYQSVEHKALLWKTLCQTLKK